jgi:DNA (cytosine-5)-methyltransferase 1
VLSIDSDRFQDRSSRSYTSSSHTSKARGKPEPRSNGSITLPDVEIQKYRLDNGVLIEPGDTVELKDFSKQSLDGLYSGDFLRVKHVITNLTTDEVRLRGYLLRRTKYLRQIFDCKS